MVIGMYDLPNVGCMGLEVAENTLCLGADFDCWTFYYVKVQIGYIEVNNIIKACQSQAEKWCSKFVHLLCAKETTSISLQCLH